MKDYTRYPKECNSGPRGDCYEWCRILDNNTLQFGNEQGNYAGGVTLSYNWCGDILTRKRLPVDHVPTEEYWDCVIKKLNYIKDDPDMKEYLDEIMDMCQEHNITEILDRMKP